MKFTSFVKSLNNNLPPKSDEIETTLLLEWRQAHCSFNATLTAIGVSACISLAGAVLVL